MALQYYKSSIIIQVVLICSIGLSQTLALQWTSCGDATNLIQLTELTVTPDVLKIPGPISVSARFKLASNVTSPIKMALKVKKKVAMVYIPLPCEDEMGSCTYDNVCALSPYSDACPAVYDKYHLPCKCPIDKGSYIVKNFPLTIKGSFPKFLVSGKYKANIRLTMGEENLGCFDVKLTLK